MYLFLVLVALQELLWHFDIPHEFYASLSPACMLSWLCMQKSTNALLRDVCKSVAEGEQCNEEKHDIPIATVAKLFMLMLSRKLPVI